MTVGKGPTSIFRWSASRVFSDAYGRAGHLTVGLNLQKNGKWRSIKVRGGAAW